MKTKAAKSMVCDIKCPVSCDKLEEKYVLPDQRIKPAHLTELPGQAQKTFLLKTKVLFTNIFKLNVLFLLLLSI